jgi:hypothetical protein
MFAGRNGHRPCAAPQEETSMQRSVELRVREGGGDVLVYTFATVTDAAEMIHFLSDFFPAAEFLVQPIRH